MKYYAEITTWGAEALAFLDDPNANFIIIFDNNAPPELAEISVLHTMANYNEDPVPGDTLILADKAFTITAVGDEVLHTLRTLGHCTISFKGGAEPERPGCIMVEGDVPLVAGDIKMGATIEIY